MNKFHTIYTKDNRYLMHDIEIKEKNTEHIYKALRGSCACLGVFSKEDKCLGWIDTRTLGYETAKDWLLAEYSK